MENPIDTSTPNIEPVLPPDVSNQPAGNRNINVFLELATFIFLLGGGYLFWKTQAKDMYQNTSVPVEVSPTATPGAPNYEVRSYTNKTYEYSFDYWYFDPIPYPQGVVQVVQLENDDSIVIGALDSISIQVEAIKTTQTDPIKWWKTLSTEPIHGIKTSCFTTENITELKSSHKTGETLTTVPTGSILVLLKDTPECMDRNWPIVIIPHNGKLLRLMYDGGVDSKAIISSLKFFDTASNE